MSGELFYVMDTFSFQKVNRPLLLVDGIFIEKEDFLVALKTGLPLLSTLSKRYLSKGLLTYFYKRIITFLHFSSSFKITSCPFKQESETTMAHKKGVRKNF